MGLAEIKARTAADRAAGIRRVYVRHIGGPKYTGPAVAPGHAPRRALPVLDCRHGGTDRDIVERHPGCATGARHKRRCERWQVVTRETTGGAHMSCARCRRDGLGYEPVGAPRVAVLVTGGIGDAITVESMLRPEERDRLEAVYYACPAAREIERLWRALPNYPRLSQHVVLPTGSRTLYSRAQVEAATGPLPASVRDLSINVLFRQNLSAGTSSLLAHTLAHPERPDRPYVVVVPYSTWYAPAGRAFDAADWRACFEALERYDLVGLVLCRERLPVPDHPRLIDRQGETTILESVELVKGAAGYLGIDSWASVLAARLFPAARISVKCVPGCHGWNHRARYYAPRTEFTWLTPGLEVPPWN